MNYKCKNCQQDFKVEGRWLECKNCRRSIENPEWIERSKTALSSHGLVRKEVLGKDGYQKDQPEFPLEVNL